MTLPVLLTGYDIAKLPPAAKGTRYGMADKRQPGLLIRVSSLWKSFYWHGQLDGQQVKVQATAVAPTGSSQNSIRLKATSKSPACSTSEAFGDDGRGLVGDQLAPAHALHDACAAAYGVALDGAAGTKVSSREPP